jgi:hypothetical protein
MVGRAHLRQAEGRVRKLVEKWIKITHQEMNKVSVFILTDFECLTMQCIGKSKNDWIRPFLQAWHRPPFSLLPRWRDGLHVLYALAQHPTAIPEYNHTIPFSDIRFKEAPSLSHIIEDLFERPTQTLSLSTRG